MPILVHADTQNASGEMSREYVDIDLESTHKVINTLMEALQRHFKEDTHYERPLMSPQANILFALDNDAVEKMTAYISEKLVTLGGFTTAEFTFTCRSGNNGEVLKRLRLEFPDGVTAPILRKLLITTDKLERILPAYNA